MTPETPVVNLRVKQGSEFRWTYKYVEDDGVTPIPLSGFTARAQVRESVWSSDYVYEATTENGGLEITDPANGIVLFKIPGAESTSWLIDKGVYDIELVDGASKPYRLVQGEISISREVTR